MIPVGFNYGKKVPCPLCKSVEGDSQQHLFNCLILKLSNSELFNNQNIKYEDIFSLNLQKLINVAKICESIARKRAELIE